VCVCVCVWGGGGRVRQELWLAAESDVKPWSWAMVSRPPDLRAVTIAPPKPGGEGGQARGVGGAWSAAKSSVKPTQLGGALQLSDDIQAT
jgi:hypothetical protein